MIKPVTLIADYTGRFALYGFGFGGIFGMVVGTLISLSESRELWGLGLGLFFGCGMGCAMGIGTGLVSGFVAYLFFNPPTASFRPVMLACAFFTAFLSGSVIVKLIFYGTGSNNQWDVIFLFAAGGAIGAVIAAYKITGHKLRRTTG